MLEKKRYLLVAIHGPVVTEESARHLIYDAVFEALGEIGAREANVQLTVLEKKKGADGVERQMAVIKCKLAGLDPVLAALALKRKWRNADVALRVTKISGAIGRLTEVKRNPKHA